MKSVKETVSHQTGNIKYKMVEDETQYSEFKPKEMKIVACTFNVAEEFSNIVGPWIAKNDADIYSIGLQEVDMSAKNIVTNKSDGKKLWDLELDSVFLKDGKNQKLVQNNLWACTL